MNALEQTKAALGPVTNEDPLAQAIRHSFNGVKELREENARLAEIATVHEKRADLLAAELAMTKEALVNSQRECKRVDRFNVELVTQLNNVKGIIGDCFTHAEQAQYLPHPVPPAPPAESEEEIPKFLAKGPAVGNKPDQ